MLARDYYALNCGFFWPDTHNVVIELGCRRDESAENRVPIRIIIFGDDATFEDGQPGRRGSERNIKNAVKLVSALDGESNPAPLRIAPGVWLKPRKAIPLGWRVHRTWVGTDGEHRQITNGTVMDEYISVESVYDPVRVGQLYTRLSGEWAAKERGRIDLAAGLGIQPSEVRWTYDGQRIVLRAAATQRALDDASATLDSTKFRVEVL